MSYERMLDKAHEPTDQEILNTIGETGAWLDLRAYIEEHYDFAPQLAFYGKKYGWAVRYRKSGRTLCSLFPERGAFSALVVLGKKGAEKALSMVDDLTPAVGRVLTETDQLHDGRWLWVRVHGLDQANDVKLLLSAKRKPKKDRSLAVNSRA